jgi:hypothetical protein
MQRVKRWRLIHEREDRKEAESDKDREENLFAEAGPSQGVVRGGIQNHSRKESGTPGTTP